MDPQKRPPGWPLFISYFDYPFRSRNETKTPGLKKRENTRGERPNLGHEQFSKEPKEMGDGGKRAET